jgi:hypothetical protein
MLRSGPGINFCVGPFRFPALPVSLHMRPCRLQQQLHACMHAPVSCHNSVQNKRVCGDQERERDRESVCVVVPPVPTNIIGLTHRAAAVTRLYLASSYLLCLLCLRNRSNFAKSLCMFRQNRPASNSGIYKHRGRRAVHRCRRKVRGHVRNVDSSSLVTSLARAGNHAK